MGVASFLTPWCAKGEVPTGVNLNRYSGKGSCIPWHRDNERLFGSPSEQKVTVSMSLEHSVLFTLRRDGQFSLSNSVGSWMVLHNLSMSTPRHLNCWVLGLILRSVGYLSTLGPVHWQALAVLHLRARTIWLSHTPVVRGIPVEWSSWWQWVWKYVFVIHEGVCCRNYHRGLFSERRPFIIGRARWIGHQRWRIPRRSHLMENWLLHFLASNKGVKTRNCHL